MKEKNKVAQPLIIIAITIILLVLISLQSSDIKIGSIIIRKIDLFSDIKSDS
jgi:hypothetical protein